MTETPVECGGNEFHRNGDGDGDGDGVSIKACGKLEI